MKKYILMLASLTGLLSCSDTLSRMPCYFPDAPQTRAPGWICQPVTSRQMLTAVGFAQNSSAGVAFTKNMAMANARVKLAQRLKQQCGVRNVSEALLINTRRLNTQRSPQGAFYVEIGIRPNDLRLDCR